MTILPPSEWYAQQDLSQHFMRSTDRPFEEGVSRGQSRRLRKCEEAGYCVGIAKREICHPIIADSRHRKNRPYALSLNDWGDMKALCFAVWPGPIAVACCVNVIPGVIYVHAWGDIPRQEHLSPVVLLCEGIYYAAQVMGFATLDIGIAGDEGLASFKRRLGFKRACDE